MKSEHLSYIEHKAKQEKKELSCLATIILFTLPISIGIYYWFVDDIIFDYNTVSPFSGFFIFLLMAILLTSIASFSVKIVWKKYNAEIDNANETILSLINSEDISPNDLFRLKKDYIERKLDKDGITHDEFIWHSEQICWGCGNFHSDKKYNYCHKATKTKTWKEGAIRYTKTLEKTAYIPLCPTCINTIMTEKIADKKNKPYIITIDIILSIIIIILCAYYTKNVGDGILLGLIICTFGQIILFPMSDLLLMPFIKKTKHFSPKWDFNKIPSIKRFLDK